MRQFPIASSIIIVLLLAGIFGLFHLITEAREQQQAHPSTNTPPTKVIETEAIRVSAIFRFNTTPKTITLKDPNDKIIYQESNFDLENEHETDITIPHDKHKFSQLQLAVEWEKEADPYNFFSMEFYGHDRAKFGAGVAANIDEKIFLQW